MKLILLSVHIFLLLTLQQAQAKEAVTHEADICIYGGTASGVMAAVAAKKQGASVILVEPSRWLGGMTGGGINHLDWGREAAVGGSTFQFLTEGLEDFDVRRPRGESTYAQTTLIGHSNKIYRERFLKLVNEHGIEVIYDHRLGAVSKNGNAITKIMLDLAPVDATGCPIPEPMKKSAMTISAKVFIDCTYEGDLMAMSGTSYTWGRESRDQYGESLAGVRPNLWLYEIDPYKEEGNPESGLIRHVTDWKIGEQGSADKLTMGYCFRFKFNHKGQGIEPPKPTAYDPAEFELFRRAMRDDIDIYVTRFGPT
jgi:ribulose 1,5-bisphosphate synthetase/thiazole synthase